MNHRKALLVTSTGGHLEEMLRLAHRFTPAFDEIEYATFDNAQSRSLLASARTHFVPTIPPRGLQQSLRAILPARALIRSGRYTDVISTGAAIAVPYLAAARSLGVRAHYIESAARTQGPSLTGRLVSRIQGVHLYAQYPTWAAGSWRYSGSIFDNLAASDSAEAPASVSKVVVTLGTMRGYPFTRAVLAAERLLHEVGAPDREVLWQVGDAVADVTGGPLRTLVPADDLTAAFEEADLVIAHAGVGSSMRILESGRTPLLLYRQARYHEHVDDHQLLVARELQERGLAVSRDPEAATVEDVRWALSHSITLSDDARDFPLALQRAAPLRRQSGSTAITDR